MTDRLDAYNHNRNFERTDEPPGEETERNGNLRFAVQHHAARRDHYDLRLEWGGALLSWAVPKGPSFNPRDRRLAVRVEDHPLEYRHFEGTIPKGEYGGGTVQLWDEGTWEPMGDAAAARDAGSLKFTLHGARLRGRWALVRLKAKPGEDKENWLLLKEKDEFAQPEAGTDAFDTSIRTGRTMAQIEAGEEETLRRNPFESAEVQLAKLLKAAPEGEEWLYELKYDGYRILAYVEGNQARLVSRNGADYTHRFDAVAETLTAHAAGRTMVLDGEMVVTNDKGKTDFEALQRSLKTPRAQGLTYIAFDLLALDGEDLRLRPLTERKEKLESLLQGAPANLRYSRHVRGNGQQSFEAACAAGMEGVVGKKAGSAYTGTRNGDWVKLKCENRQEFVIAGYVRTDKKTSGVSSLLLGFYEDGVLLFAGRAGTGLGAAEGQALAEEFENIQRKEPPFTAAPCPKPNETIIWLEPRLVAEVKFAEWTAEGQLRQAVFQGLRTDKAPGDVRREPESREIGEQEEPEMPSDGSSIVVAGVKVTNPGKVIFDEPHVTKEAVVRYYAAVAERMLPYVRRRVLSIVRCPKGILQTCFYKKHPGAESRGVVTIHVATGSGTEEYFYIEDGEGLVTEAQMGTLEFHAWGSRADDLERPDVMVFDLDPDEGMDLATVRQGVGDVRLVLSELSLESYLKTSGGKGYHVVVPLEPSVPWDAFNTFARRVAEVMEARWPNRYTSNVRKARRAGKIFIDWMRNGRGATSIAPYSLRARKGARVSMPIGWDELDTVSPDGVDIAGALQRITGVDPWQGFFQTHQRLKPPET